MDTDLFADVVFEEVATPEWVGFSHQVTEADIIDVEDEKSDSDDAAHSAKPPVPPPIPGDALPNPEPQKFDKEAIKRARRQRQPPATINFDGEIIDVTPKPAPPPLPDKPRGPRSR